MFKDVEGVAVGAELIFLANQGEWTCGTEHPHMSEFHYDVEALGGPVSGDGGLEEPTRAAFGTVNGYRIAQDWTVEADLELWQEADTLDADALGYVEALIRELRACASVFGTQARLSLAQHTTIVRHWEPAEGVDSNRSIQTVVATLAMMDAPAVMLVDPWTFAEERDSAAGKLKGRGHISKLLELGFYRMVGSRFVWAWNRELSRGPLADYNYDALVAARGAGQLDETLRFPMVNEVYGALDEATSRSMGLPLPDDLMDD